MKRSLMPMLLLSLFAALNTACAPVDTEAPGADAVAVEETGEAAAALSVVTLQDGVSVNLYGSVITWSKGSGQVSINGTDNADTFFIRQFKDFSARTVRLRVVVREPGTTSEQAAEVTIPMLAFDGVDPSVDPLRTVYFQVVAKLGKGPDSVHFYQIPQNYSGITFYSDWGTGTFDSCTFPSGYVYGQGGEDWIRGAVWADGGDGRDYLEGTRWADTLKGGPEADELFGLEGNDSLFGQDGTADKLYGGDGDDVLDAGDFDSGNSYKNFCDGGSGRDTCSCPTGANNRTDCEVLR